MSDNTTAAEAQIIWAEWWEQVQVAIDTLCRLTPLEEPDDPSLFATLETGLDPDTGYTIPVARGRVLDTDGNPKGFNSNPDQRGVQVMNEINGMLLDRLHRKLQGEQG